MEEPPLRTYKISAKREANKPLNKLLRILEQQTSQTLDDEIQSLVAPLNDRAKDLILRRWGYKEWPVPTLEFLGETNGITRERVRQIVTGHNDLLADLAATAKVRISIASRISALVGDGLGVPLETLRSRITDAGIVAKDDALRTLPFLSELGLLPSFYFDSETQLFFGGDRASELRDADNPWHTAARQIITQSRASVRRYGAVHVGRIRSLPGLSVETVGRILFDGNYLLRDGYLVPSEQSSSVLSRRIQTMLAVTHELSLDELRRGLRRNAKKPIRLPVTVIKEIVTRLPDFRFENGKVALAVPASIEDFLSQAEVDLVTGIMERGGVVTQHEVSAILISKGHSPNWLQRFHYAPYVVRPAPGMYAIRGREITRRLEEPRHVSDRRRNKERILVNAQWHSATRVTLRLRATRQSLNGVIRLPKRIRLALPSEQVTWSAFVDSNLLGEMFTGSGILWDLKPFAESHGVTAGEHIQVDLDMDAKRIGLLRIPRTQAIADEAAWLAASVRPSRLRGERSQRGEVRHRKRPESLEFHTEDGWIRVPYSEVDISKVRYFRIVRPLANGDQEVLLSVFTDFPLAPEMHGVAMGLYCKLPIMRGKRSFSAALIEDHILARGSELSAAEAVELVPSLPKRLFFARHALKWREYHAPQLELTLSNVEFPPPDHT
jgi:hypothetical protein